MKIKLKCIDNTECEGYLTLNKEYLANIFSFDGYHIIDNNGDELFITLNDGCCNHGKWEVISE